MTDLILVGCCGKMGNAIAAAVSSREDIRIVAGVDVVAKEGLGFPCYSDIYSVKEKGDCIIDFSHPSSLNGTLSYSVEKNIPAVIATTGLSEAQHQQISAASNQVAIFFSANMSIGVNLVCELAKKAASVLGGDFDIEIIEKHHNQKIDAPSGTALMIANEINSGSDNSYSYNFDRHAQRKKRDKQEIGIVSIRGGNIVGEHEVIYAGVDEVISITHTATSKNVFAVGAVNAAVFLKDCAPGLYNMKDLIEKG